MYVLSSFHLELWLEWLKDEIPLACIPEQREKVTALFERAVKDYQCKVIYNSTYLPCNICCCNCTKSSQRHEKLNTIVCKMVDLIDKKSLCVVYLFNCDLVFKNLV